MKSNYKILPYSYKQAKKLNVQIYPSTKNGKKIDVWKNNKYITSIGAIGYKDYPTYLKEDGKQIANEHRYRYKIRHARDIENFPRGYYAYHILW